MPKFVKTIETNTRDVLDDAKNSGAMALFGEKRRDDVRVVGWATSPLNCVVVHMPDKPVISVSSKSSESGVAAGVRRIEAVAGEAASAYSSIGRTVGRSRGNCQGDQLSWPAKSPDARS